MLCDIDEEEDVNHPSHLRRTIAHLEHTARTWRVEEIEQEPITCSAADRHLEDMRFFLLRCALYTYTDRVKACGPEQKMFYDLTGSCGINVLAVCEHAALHGKTSAHGRRACCTLGRQSIDGACCRLNILLWLQEAMRIPGTHSRAQRSNVQCSGVYALSNLRRPRLLSWSQIKLFENAAGAT